MTDVGRAVPDGLSQAEPEEVSALTGFDPSREALVEMLRDSETLSDLRNCNRVQTAQLMERAAAYIEADAIVIGHLMETARSYRHGGFGADLLDDLEAIAMEAREGRDGETRLDAKHDSAGPKDIAQSQSSPTGDQR